MALSCSYINPRNVRQKFGVKGESGVSCSSMKMVSAHLGRDMNLRLVQLLLQLLLGQHSALRCLLEVRNLRWERCHWIVGCLRIRSMM